MESNSDKTNVKEYRVLVTGFGANKHAPHGNASSNPAGEIAAIMPSILAADNILNTSGVDIKLLAGIKDEWTSISAVYSDARKAIKEVHEQYGDQVDLWIHLGRMGGLFYGCERRAFSQDFSSSWNGSTGYYWVLDNLDQKASDIGPNPWPSVPLGLDTDLDVSNIVTEADKIYKKYRLAQDSGRDVLEIRSHIEAGAALCGFVFYESMAHCWSAGKKRHVLFCHVPPDVDKESLERGRDAILAIIGASIACIITEAKNLPRDRRKFLDEP